MSLQAIKTALAQGAYQQAIALAQPALAQAGADPAVRHLLGAALLGSGQSAEAVQVLEAALVADPHIASSWSNLAIARWQARLGDAVAAAERAVQLAPRQAGTHNSLGYVLLQTGGAAQAIAPLRQAIALQADFAEAWLNLSHALRQSGTFADALMAADTALKLRPHDAKSLRAKAQVLAALGQAPAALAVLHATSPTDAEGLIDLGLILQQSGQLSAAIQALRQAVRLEPGNRRGWTNLGAALRALGDLAAATNCYDQALAVDPAYAPAWSNRLLCLHYRDDLSPVERFQAHADFGRHFSSPPPGSMRVRQLGQALRVGLVSADLRRHSVAYFLAPWLAARDRRQVHVTAYSDVTHPDDVTTKLQALTDGWHTVAGWSDSALAAQIRADRVDVLIDLSGHTAGNRLPMFAQRPAPVQMTWLGYPGTTGLPAMDWRLTDAFTDPPGAEQFYSEKLLRLDRPFLCYAPPRDAPAVALRRAGPVTFGSFNNASKISQSCVALWSDVLAAVPQARLVIKSSHLGDRAAADRLRGMFTALGVAAERLTLLGPLADTGGHLAAYAQVDIALDTVPYNGTTTSCEALWMGVPVLSLRGSHHAARVGAMLLQAVGLQELIADDVPGFVSVAAKLANQPARLADLRQSLRRRVAISPICDAVDFAGAMQAALLQIAPA